MLIAYRKTAGLRRSTTDVLHDDHIDDDQGLGDKELRAGYDPDCQSGSSLTRTGDDATCSYKARG